MANYLLNITADGTYKLCSVRRNTEATNWAGTIVAGGTFGGGTIKYQLSVDGGTTKIDMKDTTGSPYSTTTADIISIPNLGAGVRNTDAPIIYAVLTGSTSASININVVDNR